MHATIENYKNIKLPVFFLDETGILRKSDDPYFALGILKTERPHELQRAIRLIRDRAHFYEEIKWNKISPVKFDVVKNIIEAFIKNVASSFSCIIIKKSELDFKNYFQDDLHRVYRSFSVLLLKKNIEDGEICTVIADDYFYPEGKNLELATRGILNDHYKKLAVTSFLQMNSKASDLLQTTDLLLGAVLYDLKLSENLIQKYPNHKFQTLNFLHKQLNVPRSFFTNKYGKKQNGFVHKKFKVSIFDPKMSRREKPI